MDKNEIFEQLGRLETTLTTTLAQVSSMKEVLNASATENATLRMEVEKLRERLADLDKKQPDKTEPNANLIELYNEGFHVCTNFYGQRREDNEPCAFCSELLYR